EGVRVMNVNELAQNLRPVALPGDRKTVKILQKGSNPKQGVGYMEDGTMIVVDNGSHLIDRTVEIEVTRMHQTESGKMLFGRLTSAKNS
ncbi:MAG: pin/tram domain protein, partial [Candidatus Saccharibacteria bacterium]|nr:pin/tram domain protein [Candidatus Saccharibacteria bacterium]